ncbi:MAG TPA: transposase [Pyrinomonadaceae bacterium]|nr:transposase [Pyrinomonadaceae bacterium]
MSLAGTLSQFWLTVQGSLFPWLQAELGELSAKQQQLVKILELVQIESFLKSAGRGLGRPSEDRQAIARAFVAKAVYNLETTRQLLERIASDERLRRLCGWERAGVVPSEATFSRAFAEFSASQLPPRVHAALLEKYQKPRLVGHISRDATAINAREKAVRKVKPAPVTKVKRPRRKKGEASNKPLTRLQRQISMTLAEMLADLPQPCDCGTKRNSKGHPSYWVGYKLHLDVADGGIPISAILTSASVNDCQVALPLAHMTAARVDHLYDLMDSAYDMPAIREKSIALGHVPIIDGHTRRGGDKPQFAPHEAQRYKERTTIERVFARLKEEFGGRMVRVRGPAKVMTSLLFGLLALTADQLLRLIS